MSEPPALLDVNVPMYAAGRDHPLRSPCARLMTMIADGELDVVIDTETVQEVLYRYGALGQIPVAVAVARSLMAIVPKVLAVTASDMVRAVEVFEMHAAAGLTARDAIHVAVMQGNGIDRIISTDRHFDQVAGITRLDPAALAGAP